VSRKGKEETNMCSLKNKTNKQTKKTTGRFSKEK
jgi:hypothetical protein